MVDTEFPEPNSSLGERLINGVRNLWRRVIALEETSAETRKIVDHQGAEIEAIRAEFRAELADLRRQLRGAKIGRGRAVAKSARLQQQITEAEKLLSETEKRLH